MSRRSIDMHAESALADFLDTYFYSRLLDEGLFSSIERIHDIGMQKSGGGCLCELQRFYDIYR